jgi:hypothetical protein
VTPSVTPSVTATPSVTPSASAVTPINVATFGAFSSYNEFTEQWTLFISVTLDGNVNTDTVLDASVDIGGGGPQIFGITIFNGNSSATVSNAYIFDPEPVSANCLTFVSGDTRVNTGIYTCP